MLTTTFPSIFTFCNIKTLRPFEQLLSQWSSIFKNKIFQRGNSCVKPGYQTLLVSFPKGLRPSFELEVTNFKSVTNRQWIRQDRFWHYYKGGNWQKRVDLRVLTPINQFSLLKQSILHSTNFRQFEISVIMYHQNIRKGFPNQILSHKSQLFSVVSQNKR